MATTTDKSMATERKFTGCSPLSAYQIMDKIGEGTFGVVYKALSLEKRFPVAMKRIIFPYEKATGSKRRELEEDGVPLLFIRETRILSLLSHKNICELLDVVAEHGPEKRSFFYHVFPFLDHDLAGLIENVAFRFTHPVIKCLLSQMLEGLLYLHSNNLIHRDIKPANLLISSEGILKIGDFGLTRPVDHERDGSYTPNVVTRWYRAPEVCLNARNYTSAIDIWSAGCILGEMIKQKPIMAGSSDIEQINRIWEMAGRPSIVKWRKWKELPGAAGVADAPYHGGKLKQEFESEPSEFVDLLAAMLTLDPEKRISAIDALDSDYLWSYPPAMKPEDLPRVDSSHEYFTSIAQERRMKLGL